MGLDDPLDAQMVSLRVVKVLRYVALRVDDDRAPRRFVADQVRRVREALQVVLREDQDLAFQARESIVVCVLTQVDQARKPKTD